MLTHLARPHVIVSHPDGCTIRRSCGVDGAGVGEVIKVSALSTCA